MFVPAGVSLPLGAISARDLKRQRYRAPGYMAGTRALCYTGQHQAWHSSRDLGTYAIYVPGKVGMPLAVWESGGPERTATPGGSRVKYLYAGTGRDRYLRTMYRSEVQKVARYMYI